MLVYVLLVRKEKMLVGVEVFKTLEEAGKYREKISDYKCDIKRKVLL